MTQWWAVMRRMIDISSKLSDWENDILEIQVKTKNQSCYKYERGWNDVCFNMKKRLNTQSRAWITEEKNISDNMLYVSLYNNHLLASAITLITWDGKRRCFILHKYEKYIKNTIEKRTKYIRNVLYYKNLPKDIVDIIISDYAKDMVERQDMMCCGKAQSNYFVKFANLTDKCSL
jgi:hypothetical protein